MAIDRRAPKLLPSWSRLVEWSVLGGVVIVLGFAMARQVRGVQAQAELAALQSTLGALRTAFVIDYAHRHTLGPAAGAKVQRNPFQLLDRHPVNYQGEMTAADAAAAGAIGWVFDPECVCVGYQPLEAEWLSSPSGDVMAWYQVSSAPGPLQLTAKEAYAWQGKGIK